MATNRRRPSLRHQRRITTFTCQTSTSAVNQTHALSIKHVSSQSNTSADNQTQMYHLNIEHYWGGYFCRYCLMKCMVSHGVFPSTSCHITVLVTLVECLRKKLICRCVCMYVCLKDRELHVCVTVCVCVYFVCIIYVYTCYLEPATLDS